jgi:hypothetical protein
MNALFLDHQQKVGVTDGTGKKFAFSNNSSNFRLLLNNNNNNNNLSNNNNSNSKQTSSVEKVHMK